MSYNPTYHPSNQANSHSQQGGQVNSQQPYYQGGQTHYLQPNPQFNHGQPSLPSGYTAPPAAAGPSSSAFGASPYGQYSSQPFSQQPYSGYASPQGYVAYPPAPNSGQPSPNHTNVYGYTSQQDYVKPALSQPAALAPQYQYPPSPYARLAPAPYSNHYPQSPYAGQASAPPYNHYPNPQFSQPGYAASSGSSPAFGAPSSQPVYAAAAPTYGGYGANPSSSPASGAPSPQPGYAASPSLAPSPPSNPPPAPPSAPSPSKSVAMAPSPKDSEILEGRDLSLKTIVFGKGSPALFSPPRVTEAKIPNRLIEKKDYKSYWGIEPGAGEILYHLDEEEYKVSYKYRDVAGELKSGEIALGDVDSRYKDTLPKRSLESAESASQWSRDFNQKLNETISKQIQKKYTDNLKLIKFSNAGSYNTTLPYEGEVLYCLMRDEIHCKYWVLEDLSLSLVNKQYTTEAFFANKGDRSIQDRISDQVKLIFDLAEYLRTIKQEISNTLGTPTQRAKKSVAEKLVAYLKDRANAEIPKFTEEEISVIYKGVFSHRLGDLVDRAKAIYELENVLKATPTPFQK